MSPLILLTNDDGIAHVGLKKLYDRIKESGDVWVVAPHKQRSGAGHSITLSEPIRYRKYEQYYKKNAFQCTGTPVDCVKIAIKNILPRKPDLLISGINQGANIGLFILYSGTVAAALEGSIQGIPSIAISLDSGFNPDFSFSAKVAGKIAAKVLFEDLPGNLMLNVNVPSSVRGKYQGFKITKLGKTSFLDEYDQSMDSGNNPLFRMTGKKRVNHESASSDGGAIDRQKISITPLKARMTDSTIISKIIHWENEL